MKSGGSRGQEKEIGTQARDIKPETVEFVQGLNYKKRTLEGCLRKYSQKAPCREAITIISPSPSTSSISDFSVSCLDRQLDFFIWQFLILNYLSQIDAQVNIRSNLLTFSTQTKVQKIFFSAYCRGTNGVPTRCSTECATQTHIYDPRASKISVRSSALLSKAVPLLRLPNRCSWLY